MVSPRVASFLGYQGRPSRWNQSTAAPAGSITTWGAVSSWNRNLCYCRRARGVYICTAGQNATPHPLHAALPPSPHHPPTLPPPPPPGNRTGKHSALTKLFLLRRQSCVHVLHHSADDPELLARTALATTTTALRLILGRRSRNCSCWICRSTGGTWHWVGSCEKSARTRMGEQGDMYEGSRR